MSNSFPAFFLYRGMVLVSFLLAFVPYVLPWHYYPNGDFLTQSAAVVCVMGVVLFGVCYVPDIKVGLVEFGLFSFAAVLLFIGGKSGSVAFLLLLLGSLLFSVFRSVYGSERERVFDAVLYGLCAGGGVTLLASLVQVFNLEAVLLGVVFDDNNPRGAQCRC